MNSESAVANNGFAPVPDQALVDAILSRRLSELHRKIIVLDDDPTGMQTIHGLSVFLHWDLKTIRQGFAENSDMFYILTNSRRLTPQHTKERHQEIARNVLAVAHECRKRFIILSRSDSTLRGHFPLETETLHEELARATGSGYDGEIIIPFFAEGGRYTIENIHYVTQKDKLVPVAHTEYACDKIFAYKNSHLGKWCEEKTHGRYPASDMVYIGLNSLRAMDINGIAAQLMNVQNFNKVLVNALDYSDIKVFLCACLIAIEAGKNFLFRTAASFTKVLGAIPNKALIKKEELISSESSNGGLVIIASPVEQATRQLEYLKKKLPDMLYLEFNQRAAFYPNQMEQEIKRVMQLANSSIGKGQTVVIHTQRERIDASYGSYDAEYMFTSAISQMVSQMAAEICVQPAFLLAKGGSTASDVIDGALDCNRICVVGQVAFGVPVWVTENTSRFSNMPFLIFPGNVGEENALYQVIKELL